MNIDAFLASLSLVTIAEIGDKTQLLALMLAARYRKPVPIILGILVATTANHAMAAWLGHYIGMTVEGTAMRVSVSVLFIVIGLWALIPDKLEEPESQCRINAFMASLVAFFLAEMGDKTQLATMALGAQYQNLVQVITGTTIGMLIANIPAVLLGDKLLKKIPLQLMRYIASVLFIAFGIGGIISIFL